MTEERPATRRLPLSPRRLALIGLGVGIVALAIYGLRDTLTFETLRANRETLLAWRDANYLAAVAGYMAIYVTAIALSLPGGAVMTMTGGFLFGLVAGTAMTVVAATAGATLIFLAAKAGFGDALHRRITAEGSGGLLKRLEAGLRENAFNYLLMIRLVPAFPFWLINLAPAFLGIRLGTYVAATFLGIIPGTAVYTWIGAGLGEVFARGEEPDLGLIFDPVILGPILGLAAFAILPVVIRKVRGRGDGMNRLLKPDLCVIGGGSGGLTVAAGAAQMGASVVLVEGHKMGGDCLNYGCVPSKALIAAAGHAHAMRTGGPFGVAPVEPQVDYAAAKDHVARVIEGIAPHDSVERFEGLGVTVIGDWARFVSPTRVEAGGTAIEARRFVIATGSAPFVPPIPGLDAVRHYTNEDIFALRDRPRHLIVIGGGPIGIEMAQAHRRLGSDVTVIEGAQVLGREDPDLAAIVIERLRAEGVRLVEGAQAERIDSVECGVGVTVGAERVDGSHLLVAVGRRVNLERLDTEAGGVKTTRAGVEVDRGLRSVSNRRVYAIGDAAGGMQFTHVAGYHAGLVIRNALFGLPVRARVDHIPRVTFTDPELAQVGLTEDEARKLHGDGIEVLRFGYDEIDRARAQLRTEGIIKVVVAKGRPVGAGIVGAKAGELIGLWSLAIANRMKIGQVAGMVAPYPTLGEVSKRAAGQYYVPRLFQSDRVKHVVRLVQRWLP